MKHSKKNKSTIKRGGGAKTLQKKLTLGKLSVNARVSELDMFEAYHKFVKYRLKFLKNYQEHRDDLKELDKKIGNTKTLITCFDEIVMPKEVLSGEPIDEKNPLLYTNYYLNNDSLVKDLIEEHYKQQIYYYYYTKFNKKDLAILKAISVKGISSSSVKLEFVGKNNKYYLRECKIVDDMMLDKDTIIGIIENITDAIKKNKSEYISEPKKLAEKKALEEAEKKALEEEEARRAENALRPPGMPGIYKPAPVISLAPVATAPTAPISGATSTPGFNTSKPIVAQEIKAEPDINLLDLIKSKGLNNLRKPNPEFRKSVKK
jgi:hypothetical protein